MAAVLVSYLLAVLTAASNATSNVLERVANRREPPERAFSLRLIWDLLHSKAWIGGVGAMTLSFLLQAAALSTGHLASVQPIVVLELPLTLAGGSLVFHAPLGKAGWIASAFMTVGLGGLIGSLQPGSSTGRVTLLAWVLGLIATGGAVVVLTLLGRSTSGTRRAALLGAATGIEFGLTAVLMKETTKHFSAGIASLLTTWSPYAMVAAGVAGMFLMQNALQAGRLVAAQPGITLLDPFVAIAWGVFAFHEPVNHGYFLVTALLSGLLMVAGVMILSHSRALAAARTDDPAKSGEKAQNEQEPTSAAGEDSTQSR